MLVSRTRPLCATCTHNMVDFIHTKVLKRTVWKSLETQQHRSETLFSLTWSPVGTLNL